MKVKLTRLSSTHENLRTTVVEGTSDALPEVGKPFKLIGEPLDPAASFRMVYTTPIQHLEVVGDVYRCRTENSLYEIEVTRVDNDKK